MPDLPVREVLDDLVAAMGDTRRAVLEAPPGAGKTTLVPPALAAAPWLEGRCVVLEPRRIAARAAASRMAELLGEPLGQTVGYTTGEGRKVSAATRIEVVTEGVLVRRLQRDPTAEGIGAVVLDEFHERSIEADLALAFSLEVQQTIRPDLALLVMSATLDGGRVTRLLGDPAVLHSEGRTHPVTTVHRPVPADARVGVVVADAVRAALDEWEGDVLAFLPGQREIGEAQGALSGLDVDVLPLYGALPPARQREALRPGSRRRVVLATDIAESSLTVPGVRIVVDAGWARRPAFDPATGMSRLRTVRVSRSSADQRRGRAARQGPGLCVRLWAEHEALEAHAPPAIAEEDLAPTALEVAAWGTPVEGLALLDQPPAASWAAASSLLGSLGALEEEGRLTDHGRAMADLPVHPRLAHMVLQAPASLRQRACLVAALLGERDILISRDTDLDRRVALLSGGSPAGRGGPVRDGAVRDGAVRDGAVRRVRQNAERIARRVRAASGDEAVPPDATGQLVALAYPDRVAVSRGRRGAFVMSGGRGASLHPSDPLAGEPMIAVASLDRGGVEARVYLAAAVDESTVAGMATPRDVVEWRDGDVVAERRLAYGAVVLSTTPLADPPRDRVVAALLEGVAAEELRPLPWSRGTAGLRDRLRHLHRTRAADGWPAVDDATLIGTVGEWLGPFLTTARRRRDLAGVALADALLSRVPYELHHRLDELAPTHVEVPTGSRIRVDYGGERPVLAVKLQEMFGLVETPQVAGAPVLLHLLSPAGRPLQVTDDLGGFWTGSYAQVRAEMRGRYPKHPWPEDPASARPTRYTKARAAREDG